MKLSRTSAGLGVFTLVATVGAITLLQPHKAAADPEGCGSGGTYVTTVADSTGAFSSRGVITLHAGGTMSVLDSGQGGPTFFFTSQLGSWKPDGKGGVVAKTIDFDLPPSPDVARLDYSLKFEQGGKQLTGTVTLRTFTPLATANPLGSGGTVAGTFTVTGDLVQP